MLVDRRGIDGDLSDRLVVGALGQVERVLRDRAILEHGRVAVIGELRVREVRAVLAELRPRRFERRLGLFGGRLVGLRGVKLLE